MSRKTALGLSLLKMAYGADYPPFVKEEILGELNRRAEKSATKGSVGRALFRAAAAEGDEKVFLQQAALKKLHRGVQR